MGVAVSETAKQVILASVRNVGPLVSFEELILTLYGSKKRIVRSGAKITSDNARKWVDELVSEGRLERVELFKKTCSGDSPITALEIPEREKRREL